MANANCLLRRAADRARLFQLKCTQANGAGAVLATQFDSSKRRLTQAPATYPGTCFASPTFAGAAAAVVVSFPGFGWLEAA